MLSLDKKSILPHPVRTHSSTLRFVLGEEPCGRFANAPVELYRKEQGVNFRRIETLKLSENII